jgi:membrane fusion protein, multidrug efflux system
VVIARPVADRDAANDSPDREHLAVKSAIVLIVVVGAAVVAVVSYHRTHEALPVQAAAQAVQSVSTVPVRVAPMVESVAAYGNLVSARSVNIVPQTSGQVREILFEDGQTVSAGAALVIMDSGIAEAQLQSSRAQAETDLQNLRRTQSLSRQGLESTYSTEQALSRSAASQADVKINERRLSQLTLRAPFAGTLGSSLIDVGAFVNTGDTIVRLDDTSELQVEFRLPSSTARKVTNGMPIHIQVPGTGRDELVDGKLSFIDPTISTDTRSVLLRAVARNAEKHLRPGRFVRVSIDLNTDPTALVVPAEAVSNDLNASYVFVIDDQNIAHKRVVTVGLTDGERMELLDGVAAGDQVVTIGQFRLRDGDRVKVIAAPPDAKSAG